MMHRLRDMMYLPKANIIEKRPSRNRLGLFSGYADRQGDLQEVPYLGCIPHRQGVQRVHRLPPHPPRQLDVLCAFRPYESRDRYPAVWR